MPQASKPQRQGAGRPPLTDYQGWLNLLQRSKHKCVLIKRGEDFDCQPSTIRQGIYDWFNRREMPVSVHIIDQDTVQITLVQPESDQLQ